MRRRKYYILKDKIPIVVDDLFEWAKNMGDISNTVVKKTVIGETEVSTVFLGVDYQCFNGPPLLFETMIFGGEFDQDVVRCSTWEQAEEQHRDRVYKLTGLET